MAIPRDFGSLKSLSIRLTSEKNVFGNTNIIQLYNL